MDRAFETTVFRIPVIRRASQAGELFWANPKKKPAEEMCREFKDGQGRILGYEDIEDAERRLSYFGPLIARCFRRRPRREGSLSPHLFPFGGWSSS